MTGPTDLTDSTEPKPTDSETDPEADIMADTLDLYESLAGLYDSHYREPIHVAEDRATCLLLNPYIGRADYVMDIGCGTGWLLDQFPGLQPYEYMGVDLSYSMLTAARAKHPEYQFIQSDLRDFVTAPVKGLIVSTFGTLSHLPPETWVPCLAELAAPGCEYFITLLTPAALTRKSSLAHTHPHLIHPAQADHVQELLTRHGLPPFEVFGLNPWGDDIPPILKGASTEAVAGALIIDSATRVVPTRDSAHGGTRARHLLGIGGRKE